MHRIFIVDDHPMMRNGLRDLIKRKDDYELCGEAETAVAALVEVPKSKADLVLLDLTLPDRNGLELMKDLLARDRGLRVLVFSMHDEMLYAERVIRAGGHGYLMKGASPERILDAVKHVLDGSIHLSDRVARHILGNLGPKQESGIKLSMDSLTDRELEIFDLLGNGIGYPEIADRLGISPRTVDTHRTNIRLKLGLPDSNAVMRQAVVWVELAKEAQD